MRFSFAESMCDPSQYPELARAAEEAGFTGFTVPDSIVYPEHDDADYPYTDDGGRGFLKGKPFIEPFVLMAALCAITRHIRFNSFVIKLPIRQPVLVAKQATSLAVISGGRFGLGVGLSPWPQDYRATGTAWPRRGRRLEEMIEIIRGLSAGGYFSYDGEFYQVPSVELCPIPERPVPILIGGHSDAALRRAARLGDGWMHAGGDREEMLASVRKLRAYRKAYGRADDPFEIHVLSPADYTPDGVKSLEDEGVTDCVVAVRNPYAPDAMTLEEKVGALRRFADGLIQPG